MRSLGLIVRREFAAYFASPLAYVILVVFLVASASVTFFIGDFFQRGRADLTPFFSFHPWLLLALVPAIGMRLWAEERRTGTIELLTTLPIATWQAVWGKFLAGWLFAIMALALTFPLWIAVNWLGSPDNGVILTSYVGSAAIAGALLAVSSCMSALTRNQVIAFVTSLAAGFLLNLGGLDPVIDRLSGWVPRSATAIVTALSLPGHFDALLKGVIDLTDIVFFLSLIGICLFVNQQIVDLKKGS